MSDVKTTFYTNIKRKYCQECGAPIYFKYSVSDLYFDITNDGTISVDTNNLLWDEAGLSFFCCNDSEHTIGENPEMIKWQEEIEKFFNKNIAGNIILEAEDI